MLDTFIILGCSIAGLCETSGCRPVTHMEQAYTVCSYRTEHVTLKTMLNDKDGFAFGSLDTAIESLNGTGKPPLMVMNGGMYHEDLSPVGLYIEGGKKQQNLSTKGGWGNFHLLPNGVFWTKGKRAGVTESKAFKKAKIKADFATQSGPMLVINGKLHPRFLQDSTSRKIRNGVGISQNGQWTHFAISQRFVTFYEFGTLFKDTLGAKNALFLDGSISSIRANNAKQGGWRPVGPIIAVFP